MHKKHPLESKIRDDQIYISPNSTNTAKPVQNVNGVNGIRELDQNVQHLFETLTQDANDSINSPHLSPKRKVYLQQLCVIAYLGLITGLRPGHMRYAKNSTIEKNYGVLTILYKHIQLETSTNKITVRFKSKTNIINKSYFLNSVFFDILFSIYGNKIDSNQRIFNLITSKQLHLYLDSIISGLRFKMFRKYVATTLVYASHISTINKQVQIETDDVEFKPAEIHRIFYNTIYKTAMQALDHSCLESLFYYVDPQLIISIFNKLTFIRDLNLKKKLIKCYISYLYKNKTVSKSLEELDFSLFDYSLSNFELLKN